MSDEEDVEVNVVSEAEDSSNDAKKPFKDSLKLKNKINVINSKKPDGKLNAAFPPKLSLISSNPRSSPEMKKRMEEFSDRRAEEWLELRGIDFERWKKLSQQAKLVSNHSDLPSPTNYNEIKNGKSEPARMDSPKFKNIEQYCDNVSRNMELKRIHLSDNFKTSDIRPKSPAGRRTPDSTERAKSPNSDRVTKSPERRNFRCRSKSRSRSPVPRCRSKSPTSTPNPMYTSFSISSILSRTDSSAKKNSFSGNVQQNLVLDAATNFLNHHSACADPAMLSR